MRDLQGHHLHAESGQILVKIFCGHHDDYHTHAAKLQEASRGPAFPTHLPLCYGKAQEEDSLSQILPDK